MRRGGCKTQQVAPGVFLLAARQSPSGTFRTPAGRGVPPPTPAAPPSLPPAITAPPVVGAEDDVVRVARDRQRAALDAVQAELAEEARGYARRLRLLVELSRASAGEQCTELEMAGSWRVSQLTAASWTADAERFETCLPVALAMLDDGALSVSQAKVLLHRTRDCTQDVARAVEAEVLPAGAALCPSDLRKRVDRAVLRLESEELDGTAAERRRAEAVARRRTFARPEPDGTGLAGALLTAEQLVCWQHGMDLLERRERAADRDAGVERSADQRRADLFAALPALVLAGTAQDRASASAASAAGADPVPCPCGRTAATGCCLAVVLGGGAADADAATTSTTDARPTPSTGGAPTAGPATDVGAALAGAAAGAPLTTPAAPLPPPSPPPVIGPLVPWTLDHAQVAARITLNVLVPVATVLDLSREPGTLDRYGPVSAEHVRLLRPRQYRRVLVDGETGVPLAVDDRATEADADPAGRREQVLAMSRVEVVTDRDEAQHDPSAGLARLVDLRDLHCCGPGCSSSRTERDHLEPYPTGPTSARNLGRLSARCHHAKHGGWSLARRPDGSTSWTSPLGRRYDRPGPHTAPPRVTVEDPPSLRPEPQLAVDRRDEPWVTDPRPSATRQRSVVDPDAEPPF